MKLCDYCGRENVDDAVSCTGCGTQKFRCPKQEPIGVPSADAPAQSDEPEPDDLASRKLCDYCGRENAPDAARCYECGTPLKRRTRKIRKEKPAPVRRDFGKVRPHEWKGDLVTLLNCRSIVEADLVVAKLESVGVPAFIPDEALAQIMPGNLGALGYVRVQVCPTDYERAKALLLETPGDAEPGAPPSGGPATPPPNPGAAGGPPSVS
jgi:hypothetical protein